MTLGEKIRKLRLSKSMTQKALAEKFITRNMLSHIENGNALPSIQTVQYLAEKLDVPIGYLLSSYDDYFAYKKMQVIENIRKLYQLKLLSKCIEVIQESFGSLDDLDDELYLIVSECYFNIAMTFYKEGKLYSSHENFLLSLKYSQKTLYLTYWTTSISMLFLDFMGTIDPNLKVKLCNNTIDIEKEENYFNSYMYITALKLIEDNMIGEVTNMLDVLLVTDSIYKQHIMAKISIINGDYVTAKNILSKILQNFNENPAGMIVLFKVYSDLELCYKNNNDFENAYICSNKKLEIFKTMHE